MMKIETLYSLSRKENPKLRGMSLYWLPSEEFLTQFKNQLERSSNWERNCNFVQQNFLPMESLVFLIKFN